MDLVDQVNRLLADGHAVTSAIDIVASEEGVSPASLRVRFYRSDRRVKFKSHGNQLLDQQQAVMFLIITKILAGMDMPLSVRQGVSCIKLLFGIDVSPNVVRRTWAAYKQPLRKPKALSKSRTRPDLPEKVLLFATQFDSYIELRGGLPAICLVNVDETRIVMEGSVLKMKRAVDSTRRANLRIPYGAPIASLVSFIAASGETLLHVIVLKRNKKSTCAFKIVVNRYPSRIRGCPTLYATTETGYLDQECFASVMKAFVERWHILGRAGLECVVISDQLALHRDESLIVEMLRQRVLMWSLPVHSSHVCQPLDDVVFARLKSLWYAESHELLFQSVLSTFFNGRKSDWKNLMIPLLNQVIEQTFTVPLVKKSFENTRLYPFNRAEFVERTVRHLQGANIEATGAIDAAAAAVRLLIDNAAETVEQLELKSTEIQITTLSCVHDPHLLVHEYQSRRAAEDAKKQQKERKLMQNQCRGNSCGSVHRGGHGWLVCPCLEFRLCKRCKVSAADQMSSHQLSCLAVRSTRRRRTK